MRHTKHPPSIACWPPVTGDRPMSSHFLYFPNFPSGNKRKSPKHLPSNDLHRSVGQTSHQKPEKGSAASLLPSVSLSLRPLRPFSPCRSSPVPAVNLPKRFPRFPLFQREAATHVAQPTTRQYLAFHTEAKTRPQKTPKGKRRQPWTGTLNLGLEL